jgi:hypothetical protein
MLETDRYIQTYILQVKSVLLYSSNVGWVVISEKQTTSYTYVCIDAFILHVILALL